MTADKTFPDMESFVKHVGGEKPIKKILISNNGIAAVKFIRSVRSWVYSTFGNEKEITFVAMATPEDLLANAEFIRAADMVCHVPGGSNVNNYANVQLIVEIAQQYQVDAVWPGWGHASENSALPDTLDELGIIFIGPSGRAMDALGDKIQSTILAQSAGVPTIAWNGDDLQVDYIATNGVIPEEVFEAADVQSVELAREHIARIGCPCMIKASEGGGGKGIRVVHDLSETEAAFRQVQSELPGSPIFIMKMASASRHLEVQLLADKHGQAIALSGRDCSVQRRHQKILEEGPAIAALPNVWDEMEQAAIRLAKAVGYVNAGTVEYLYSTDDKFYFLELNPRLQVEHPVTEMISGVNLPAAQLQVAMGVPLHRIADVRTFYGKDKYGSDPILFDGEYEKENPTCKKQTSGHCIAARITAENPNDGFKPTSGNISEINFRSSKGVWGYFSVDSSGRVHEFADSQIGHVFAWGNTREDARRNLAVALKDLSIRGDIHNTVQYLKDLIEQRDYKENKFNTQWLDARIKQNIDTVKTDSVTVVLVGAVVTAHKEITSREKEYLALLERGQLPPPSLLDQTHKFDLNFRDFKYELSAARTGTTTYRITCNNSIVDAELRALSDGGFLVLMGGSSHTAYAKEDVGAQRFLIDGETCLFQDEYDPTRIIAQMGGKLLRYLVEDKAVLKKGEPFAEIEVMKMTMQLTAQEAGKISLLKPEGSVMEPGDMIASMELADPSMVKKSDRFQGKLPSLGEPWPQTLANMPHQTLQRARAKLENVMSGYKVDMEVLAQALKDLESALGNNLLPVLEVEVYLSANKNTMNHKFVAGLNKLCSEYRKSKGSISIEEFAASVIREAEHYKYQPLIALANQFRVGLNSFLVDILGKLINQYVVVESKFAELELSDAAEKDDVMQELRAQHVGRLEVVLAMSLSHLSRKPREVLTMKILQCLEKIVRTANKQVKKKGMEIIAHVASLQGGKTAEVALEARQLLIEMEHTYQEQLKNVENKLKQCIEGHPDAKQGLITSTEPTLTYLMDIIVQQNKYDATVRSMAMKMYVERVYASYNIVKIECLEDKETNNKKSPVTEFTFFSEATDSIQVGGSTATPGGGQLSSVSSFDDLTAILNGTLNEGGNNNNNNNSSSRTSDAGSSVGMDLDTFGNEASASFYPSSKLQQLGIRRASSSGSSKPGLARMASDYKARAESMSDDKKGSSIVPAYVHRNGVILYFSDLAELSGGLKGKIQKHFKKASDPVPLSVIHVIVGVLSKSEEQLAEELSTIVAGEKSTLKDHGIRRITFAVVRADEREETHHTIVAGHGGHFFTFRSSGNFEEDRLVRNIETPLAFQLDLQRLANFNIRLVPIGKSMTRSQTVHIYKATPKNNKRNSPARYFVRALVRQAEKVKFLEETNTTLGAYDAYPGPERVFVQALTALEAIQENDNMGRKNHIFMNVLSDSADVNAEYVEGIIRTLHKRYSKRLAAQNVVEFEIRVYAVLAEGAPSIPIRVIASNPTGFALNIDSYVEATDPNDPKESIYYSISEGDGGLGGALAAMGLGSNDVSSSTTDGLGSLHGKPLSTPYPISDEFDERRARASAVGTTFCYDFIDLFRRSVEGEWRTHIEQLAPQKPTCAIPTRKQMVEAQELILDDEDLNNQKVLSHGLCVTDRRPGLNAIAMVAWLITLRTPQFPDGRKIVVISNDITNKAGSFGTREDELFDRASKFARHNGLPRIYLAANSGARIGMADEVKRVFKTKFVNPSDPTKGFEYLYLEDEDYQQLGPEGRKSVVCEKVADQKHWKIKAIIGESPDLGVENLRGSGNIAGETSRAYEDCFTLSYVSGRTVGIGAYLVRLGQRVIQKGKDAPILLTGYNALNSLVGRTVYTSNLQLGGPAIKYKNGVSHLMVKNDLEGVEQVVNWLSYVPAYKNGPLPMTALSYGDHAQRLVEIHPSMLDTNYDPRILLRGMEKDGRFISGFFDRNSFTETCGGWAKTVIIGRARLGQIPMGVIIPEIRTVEMNRPADPALPDSKEEKISQAGCVWFPDSSYKTASAIADFNREGLPLMIFANWRGFSGGTRDMFDSVLKFGSYIVDELVAYKQPVFVYIPDGAMLRGGSWVVVDPSINEEMMEMYASTEARANVLEPSGAVSVKYKGRDLIVAMHRNDDVLASLDEKLKQSTNDEEIKTLRQDIQAREKHLLPLYQQIAVQFADLHDRPERMLAKGCIKSIVPWAQSRIYFYNRLRRRLAELEACKQVEEVLKLSEESLDIKPVEIVEKVFEETSGKDFNDDQAVYSFLEYEGKNALKTYLNGMLAEAISTKVVDLGRQNPTAVLKGLMGLIGKLQEEGRTEERGNLVSVLRRGVFLLKD